MATYIVAVVVVGLCALGLAGAAAVNPSFQEVLTTTVGQRGELAYAKGAEREVVEFQTAVFKNCVELNCCGANIYAESLLTCPSHEYGHHYGPEPIGLGTLSAAATCSWTLNRFTSGYPFPEVDAYTYRFGTAEAVCTIAQDVEHCTGPEEPLCAGAVVTIKAGMYSTQSWWKVNYTAPIAADLPGSGKYGTCCQLEYAGIFPPELNCIPAPRGASNETLRSIWKVPDAVGATKPASEAKTQRAKAQAAERPIVEAVAAYNKEYSGTYFTGQALIVSGPMSVVNPHGSHKWSTTGFYDGVFTVEVDAVGSGSPPSNLYYMEPGLHRFTFFKSEDYGYDKERY